MKAEHVMLFSELGIGVVLTMIIGLYCVLTTKNLVRTLIGLEIITKGVTLLIVLTGFVSGQTALAQTLAITLIVVEVAVIVVAVSLVLCIYRRTDGIASGALKEIKG